MDSVILFALGREHLSFLPRLGSLEKVPGLPCPAWRTTLAQGECLVLETGIGRDRVVQALDAAVGDSRPRQLIFAGFAGGLDATLQIGDVVLANEVANERGHRWRSPWVLPKAQVVLSVDRIAATPKEKHALHASFHAAAVDMESAAFAEWCETRRLSWLCVRAISDTADATLSPDLVALMSGGRIAPLRLAWALIRRPTFLRELLRLARDTRHAAERLAEELGKLLSV
jgi:adenosylhomocysteine nucleosidase